MKNISGFSFKVVFLCDEEFLDNDGVEIQLEETDDPEDDRDEAFSRAWTWAESNLDKYGADDYEVTLENAY